MAITGNNKKNTFAFASFPVPIHRVRRFRVACSARGSLSSSSLDSSINSHLKRMTRSLLSPRLCPAGHCTLLAIPLPSHTPHTSLSSNTSKSACTCLAGSQLASSDALASRLPEQTRANNLLLLLALFPRGVEVASQPAPSSSFTMRRRGGGGSVATSRPPLPATFLVVVLLLVVNEIATFGYGCRALKADGAVAGAGARAGTPRHGDTVLMRAAPPGPGVAEPAVYGESKRMVPQGPNPLHN
ncbi:hypothetical protein GUJ93_ZPchr0006g41632 [Zizania palustris]|uniref:Uncharacterized protein n=1 Tax=Zizania palustris TaxID=103762 RepID=A0A8J5S9A9_ZIZPA|nr:hypothetical protein GUJ93_ZPchr0024g29076 [Zizania palustris]KAG8071591.1 hypothetical protein GUJ93_ZPchr0006g41632 [Zizania palustris]